MEMEGFEYASKVLPEDPWVLTAKKWEHDGKKKWGLISEGLQQLTMLDYLMNVLDTNDDGRLTPGVSAAPRHPESSAAFAPSHEHRPTS